jgi:hypothetical protein
MSGACGNCAATTSPLTDGLCPTCRTIEAVRSTVATTNGHAPTLPPIEPTVDLGELPGELAGFVRRFVVMTPAQSDVAAVWIAHTRCFEASGQTPYLAISSAEKRSGKTRLLEVLELLVARPWLTGRVTAAVLARKVDAERPTLLLDESDAAFRGDKEYSETLRGLLNTGHRRGGRPSVSTVSCWSPPRKTPTQPASALTSSPSPTRSGMSLWEKGSPSGRATARSGSVRPPAPIFGSWTGRTDSRCPSTNPPSEGTPTQSRRSRELIPLAERT